MNNILMDAGRELDQLIAQKVMGWRKIYLPEEEGKRLGLLWYWDKQEGGLKTEAQSCPNYSTNIKDAFDLVEKTGLFKTYDFHQERETGRWQIGWGSDSAYFSAKFEAQTAPHVICLAILAQIDE